MYKIVAFKIDFPTVAKDHCCFAVAFFSAFYTPDVQKTLCWEQLLYLQHEVNSQFQSTECPPTHFLSQERLLSFNIVEVKTKLVTAENLSKIVEKIDTKHPFILIQSIEGRTHASSFLPRSASRYIVINSSEELSQKNVDNPFDLFECLKKEYDCSLENIINHISQSWPTDVHIQFVQYVPIS